MPTPDRSAATRPRPLTVAQRRRLGGIERELRHALATRPTPTDSWLNGYRYDVRWLVERLKERL